MPLLELRGVYKTFNPGTPDEVRALRGVDLAVEPGSFVVVIGTNGSGKSTTLNSVAGSFRVDAGTIWLAGREITCWPEHRRARLIGRVFQDPLAGTSPALSIAENLALAARRGLSRGLARSVSRRKLAEFGERVRPLGMGLEERLDNPIGSLSRGAAAREGSNPAHGQLPTALSCCSWMSTPPPSTPAAPSRSSASPTRSSAASNSPP